MKFIISEDPISYDEIYGAVSCYGIENHGKWPSYILVNPMTTRKILIDERDRTRGIEYNVVTYRYDPNRDVREGVVSSTAIFGITLIQSADVEPGFIILCG